MLNKNIFTKKRLLTYTTNLGIPIVLSAGLLAITGRCSSSKNLPPIPANITSPATALSEAFTAVASHVQPAVVTVYTEKAIRYQEPSSEFPFSDEFFQHFFGMKPHRQIPKNEPKLQQKGIGLGSGMILDDAGHILTNYHVIKDVDEIKVICQDKRDFKAEVVSVDPRTDIAVLKIKNNIPNDLPYVKLGDSDNLRVGEIVMAIGAPFGFSQTVTTGIISATKRSNIGLADYEDFLQTDAPINPGNSGGPLVNMKGEVIGVNTAIIANSQQWAGIGLTIPINMVKNIIPTLIKGEKVVRGKLGVKLQELTKDLSQLFNTKDINGALISGVEPNSTADLMGLKIGDIITKFNGQEIKTRSDLRNYVASTKPGTTIKLNIIRNGKEMILTSQLEYFNGDDGSKNDQILGGSINLKANFQALTPTLAKRYGLTDTIGIIITDIEENGLIANAELQNGDLIIEINHKRVSKINEFRQYMMEAKKSGSVLLLVKRKDDSFFVVLNLQK